MNAIVIAMCVVNICYYLPQVRMAFDYYRSIGIGSPVADLGASYFAKDILMKQIGHAYMGPIFALMNLLSFTQCAAYAVAAFRWRSLFLWTKATVMLSAGITVLFYLAIGTMSGVFHTLVLCTTGWLAAVNRKALATPETLALADSRYGRLFAFAVATGLVFFSFIVLVLSSRAASLLINPLFLYRPDSLVYVVFGKNLGDGIGLASSYISQGWYGLSNTFAIDFHWTGGMSFSRIFADYYHRFFGPENAQPPLSYPLRQQYLTGYPAYRYWFTIFPWLASDFTFPGALLLSGLFGAIYGRMWIITVREGCLVSVSLFALLSIGVLFMNANSQILDDKSLFLALLGLLALYPIRYRISGIR
ncbi:MAG: hypothetical protein RB191_00035 [Terriglobia bacterium]|nr:hypothetical protein [Terriglobia bacterium]